jgi:hypothetical protein
MTSPCSPHLPFKTGAACLPAQYDDVMKAFSSDIDNDNPCRNLSVLWLSNRKIKMKRRRLLALRPQVDKHGLVRPSKPMSSGLECNQKRNAVGDDISITRQLQLNQAPPLEQPVHV